MPKQINTSPFIVGHLYTPDDQGHAPYRVRKAAWNWGQVVEAVGMLQQQRGHGYDPNLGEAVAIVAYCRSTGEKQLAFIATPYPPIRQRRKAS